MSLLRYVRPDENVARSATFSATSAQTRYEATRANNGDPAWPWWATGGTGTLTAALAAPSTIGIVALIHPNVDAGRSISLGGGVGATLTGAKGAGGYPRNLAYVPASPLAGVSSVTIAVSGNSLNVAIGEVVIGPLRECTFPLAPGATRQIERQVIDDVDETFKHTIRYDYGSQLWTAQGSMFAEGSALDDLIAWWESSKGGTVPTLVIPNDVDNEPRLCRLTMSFKWSNDGGRQHNVQLTLEELSRGVLVG